MALPARRAPFTTDSTSRIVVATQVTGPPVQQAIDADLHTRARARVFDAGTRHELPRGGVVYSQGDAAGSVGWVAEGRLMLSVVSTDGREVILGVAGRDEMFGETALGVAAPRATTAIALEPATVILVEARTLAALSRSQTDVAAFVMHALLARVGDLQRRLAEQMMQGSEARLVHLLLELASAEDAAGDAQLPRLSQEVLARMVGTTRSRVNVLLRGLRDHGVQSRPNGIHVSPGALRRWRETRREA